MPQWRARFADAQIDRDDLTPECQRSDFFAVKLYSNIVKPAASRKFSLGPADAATRRPALSCWCTVFQGGRTIGTPSTSPMRGTFPANLA